MKTKEKESPTDLLKELRKTRETIDQEINTLTKSELRKYFENKKGILPPSDAK
mgnify:CR=1 FL=1